MNRLRGIAIVLGVALAAACGGESAQSGGGVAVEVDSVGDVVHVVNRGAPPVWSVQEFVRIAATDDTSETPLGSIGSVISDEAGEIYVADVSNARIVVFDSTGRQVRVIGRRGRGPGEFERLRSIAWAGDTLAALDEGNGRVMLLGADGSWRGSLPAQPISGPNIRLYQAGDDGFFQSGYRPLPGGTGIEYLLIGVGRNSGDTLTIPPSPVPYTGVECQAKGGFTDFQAPFSPVQLSAPSPGGELAIAVSSDYAIRFIDGTGDTVRTVSRVVRPRTISDSQWNAELAEYQQFRDQHPKASCSGSMSRASSEPPLRSITLDDEGRMWVERRTADGFGYDVFDQSGKLIGELAVPERDEGVPAYVRNNRLYLVTVDSAGGQVVHGWVVGRGDLGAQAPARPAR